MTIKSGIQLRTGSHTSVGKIRENNEDSLHLWVSSGYVVAVVADGMGGAAAGEEASRLAVEAVENGLILTSPETNNLDRMSEQTIASRLSQAIRAGNQNIVARAAVDPEMRGMGTTVTLAFVRGARAIIAHVGDSRAYLVDGEMGGITQITDDHSFVEALVAAGHLTHEQAEEHPMKNVLYRALGQNEEIEVDVYETQLHSGDRIVLCSDGLTRHVKPREIAEIVLSIDDPEIASQALVDLTNARGGEDNVSVIVIAVEGEDDDPDDTILHKPVDMEDTVDLRRVRPLVIEAVGAEQNAEGDADQRDGAHPTDQAEPPIILFDPAFERRLKDSAGEGRDIRVPEQ
jgi:serine/threonine protein phosphatase PrpC